LLGDPDGVGAADAGFLEVIGGGASGKEGAEQQGKKISKAHGDGIIHTAWHLARAKLRTSA